MCVLQAVRPPVGILCRSFEKRFPERVFDVGIAEQHAVTFAAGLATEGLVPFTTIYSTFLQRGYDQVVHDVSLQRLPGEPWGRRGRAAHTRSARRDAGESWTYGAPAQRHTFGVAARGWSGVRPRGWPNQRLAECGLCARRPQCASPWTARAWWARTARRTAAPST